MAASRCASPIERRIIFLRRAESPENFHKTVPTETPDPFMKSAYEIAMERLNKVAPSVKLTAAQKRQIADLESEYKAKIADLEISLTGKSTAARAAGDGGSGAELERLLVFERKKLQDRLEELKEKVRSGKG